MTMAILMAMFRHSVTSSSCSANTDWDDAAIDVEGTEKLKK
jgi:hypothetical protein